MGSGWMVDWIDRDRLVRGVWRLPVWGPLARVIGGTRSLLGMNPEPAPLPPVAEPAPLEAFVRRCEGGGLWAGASAVDITPRRPEGMFLGGFDFGRTCSGVRDPIFCRCLALTDGEVPLVIVALDLVGISLPRTGRIRRRLTRSHPGSVLCACTHNHQGPDTLGLWGPALAGMLPVRSGLDRAYLDWLEDRVVEAACRAMDAARPARLHLAQGAFDRAGRWVHNERAAEQDRLMRLMQLDDHAGRSIATLVQHACHPETLWKQNRRISADFCGVCCRTLEKRNGGVALYVNGALGAMVTAALAWQTPAGIREEFLDELGRAAGRRALGLVAAARRHPVEAPALRVARRTVRFAVEHNRLYALVHALGVVEQREVRGGLVSEVTFARVGPASVTALPGEPAPALGLELLARVPGEPRFLFGLAGDELGYLLPPEYFFDRAYSYETTMSPGPQAAARLALAIEHLIPPPRVNPLHTVLPPSPCMEKGGRKGG